MSAQFPKKIGHLLCLGVHVHVQLFLVNLSQKIFFSALRGARAPSASPLATPMYNSLIWSFYKQSKSGFQSATSSLWRNSRRSGYRPGARVYNGDWALWPDPSEVQGWSSLSENAPETFFCSRTSRAQQTSFTLTFYHASNSVTVSEL